MRLSEPVRYGKERAHLCHESSDGILSLRRARIVCNQSTLPRRCRARRRRRSEVGIGSRERVGIHQQHEFDIAACEEGVDVVVLERVDFLEISDLDVNSMLSRRFVRTQVEIYKSLVPHCTSSTMSRAACTMNWFIWAASSRNLAVPSPPGFDVPNSCSKMGLSFVPMMVK